MKGLFFRKNDPKIVLSFFPFFWENTIEKNFFGTFSAKVSKFLILRLLVKKKCLFLGKILNKKFFWGILVQNGYLHGSPHWRKSESWYWRMYPPPPFYYYALTDRGGLHRLTLFSSTEKILVLENVPPSLYPETKKIIGGVYKHLFGLERRFLWCLKTPVCVYKTNGFISWI